MKKASFVVLVALAVLAAAACQDSLTSPSPNSPALPKVSATAIKVEGLVGTWQATKAEGWNASIQGPRRDLVAEGGTVTLALGADKLYTIIVTMPGVKSGTDNGRWHYHEFWGSPQIDFYPSSLPNPEWGEVPAFLVALEDNTLRLWDSGMTFLPFDFGWNPKYTGLALEFTRK